MEKLKEDFIKFLIDCNALLFGEFKLKSGRVAPYFINAGMFNDGEKIRKLGEFYAHAVKDHFKDGFDGIYGPAYKGIPLCVSTVIGLEKLGINKGYIFNRKKLKDYALKDNIIGMKFDKNTRLVLVDDVITSGAAIRESLDILKQYDNPKVIGIIVSVDRQEKGPGGKNALKEVADELGIPIFSIINFKEIVQVLENKKIGGKIHIDDEMKTKVEKYRAEYGAE
ncbi:MAG TPA: orotate phosphoribosyltransferase [Candidatus Nanoarchaeia archaeon]|nr:orotate phosphoribosyltransferase [Candidatus Nanoarchaeia archaeon]